MSALGYRLNLDALLARLLYRWRGRTLLLLLLLLTLGGLAQGTIPPLWRGRAALTIQAAPGATVLVDNRAWPHALYAGAHTVVATLPDGRGAWADLTLSAGTALTLTLPTGLPEPRARSLPPAAPGTHIDQVFWADDAWRVHSVPNPEPTPDDARGTSSGPTPTPAAGQTVAVRAQSVERLATLDAYAGLADQVHAGELLREAVYHSRSAGSFRDDAGGTVEVRGWGPLAQTIPISAPLTLLRFAPDGRALLEAEQVPSGGEQVYLITEERRRVPAVAVPGHIVRLSWRPDSSAVVLHSVQGEHLTLTLVRLAPSLVAAAVADLPVADYAGALVPLTWDQAGLLWVAPDQQGESRLWHAPLTTLIPEQRGVLTACALTRLADGTLRVLTIQGAAVVIGRYQGEVFVGETTVPGVPPVAGLAGMWQGDDVLLQGDGRAWLLDVSEKAEGHE